MFALLRDSSPRLMFVQQAPTAVLLQQVPTAVLLQQAPTAVLLCDHSMACLSHDNSIILVPGTTSCSSNGLVQQHVYILLLLAPIMVRCKCRRR
ncbi:hypothetical protein RRG08_066975 [Elysia crispata]|uniref:Uncharacterized protein n=1 Tax=Elysia crispata TaxID=231223 RepID=A0AAE0Z9R8_9GAST|nr:hypothetical protein RRG08_066975 [Elysia crispata]